MRVLNQTKYSRFVCYYDDCNSCKIRYKCWTGDITAYGTLYYKIKIEAYAFFREKYGAEIDDYAISEAFEGKKSNLLSFFITGDLDSTVIACEVFHSKEWKSFREGE